MNLSDYVISFDNSLSKEICDEMMIKFDCDKNVVDGITQSRDRGYKISDSKKSREIMISDSKDWKFYDNKVYECLALNLKQYFNFIRDKLDYGFNNPKDSGYKMKKYDKNDGWFDWHVDFSINQHETTSRALAVILYLNDVNDGGCTEFRFGLQIKPQKGKMIIFPATWMFPHRGQVPISNSKYIITTFISQKTIVDNGGTY